MKKKLNGCSQGKHGGCFQAEEQLEAVFKNGIKNNNGYIKGHPELFNKSTEEITNIFFEKIRNAIREGFSFQLCSEMKPNVKLNLEKPYFIMDLKENDIRLKNLLEEGIIKSSQNRIIPEGHAA